MGETFEVDISKSHQNRILPSSKKADAYCILVTTGGNFDAVKITAVKITACSHQKMGKKHSWSLSKSMPWRVLNTQKRDVKTCAVLIRPSLCMSVDLIVFLMLAYDLIFFLSQTRMCQRCAKALIHSLILLIHSNRRSNKTDDSSVTHNWTWNHTEKTTCGLDSFCKLESPKFITSLKKVRILEP